MVDESNGTWGNVQEVPGIAALNQGRSSRINSLSCASAGICGAGGSYTDSSGDEQTFVVDETNGAWGDAEAVPGIASLGYSTGVSSLSCGSAG